MNSRARVAEAKFSERLRDAYVRRDSRITDDRYSIFNSASLFAVQSRERSLLQLLKRAGLTDLGSRTILEVGCGRGGMLRSFNHYGARPENLFGVDLLPDRIESAQRGSPHFDFRCADAQHLPFDDASFDLVSQFVMFDTILEAPVRKNVAREMVRVLRPNGVIIWYDFRFNNPRNPDTRRVGKREILNLFPDCSVELRATTLAPPITRLLAARAWLVAGLLEKIPLLCTHYIGIIRKSRPAHSD